MTMNAMSSSPIWPGTASRLLRVQCGQALLGEGVDHIAHGSSSAASSQAIADTGVPDEEARMIVALRTGLGWRDRV